MHYKNYSPHSTLHATLPGRLSISPRVSNQRRYVDTSASYPGPHLMSLAHLDSSHVKKLTDWTGSSICRHAFPGEERGVRFCIIIHRPCDVAVISNAHLNSTQDRKCLEPAHLRTVSYIPPSSEHFGCQKPDPFVELS